MLELLVVMGILAVLMAILIPVLNKARQQALQTACLSNLRQLGSIYLLYATQNSGQIPIGYSNGMGWNGYFLFNQGGFPLAGRIYKANLLKDSPKAFYCPSQDDERWQYNTPSNPWPTPNVTPAASLQIRVGYTSRPAVEWSGVASADLKPLNKPYARISQYTRKAVLADVVGIPKASPDFTNIHHRSLNVMYGDFSVHSVERSAYDAIQKLIQPYNAVPVSSGGPPLILYLDEANPKANALWNAFDRN